MSDETVISPGPYFRLTPGTRLNGIYEVDRFITAGGMGEIYRGRAVVTGDPVAIKTIRPDMAQNETAAALFRKEASSLHNLHHEAIVRYFVFTIDPTLGIPYLAMEYVEGEALSDIVRRGFLGTSDICVLMHRLATGLDAAHRHGIVHRDLSPDNVLIPEGDMAKAKIIDFGIARSPLGDGTLIGSGFAGKMNYVSPEQLGLFGGEVGPRSDIYSLGLVIAETARGKNLDMGHSHLEVIERRRRLPDLSGIDPRLLPVLQRMLQPNPKDRPASMAEIAAWIPPIEETGGRSRWLWGAAAALALTAGMGGAIYLGALDIAGLWLQSAPERPVTERSKPTAPTESALPQRADRPASLADPTERREEPSPQGRITRREAPEQPLLPDAPPATPSGALAETPFAVPRDEARIGAESPPQRDGPYVANLVPPPEAAPSPEMSRPASPSRRPAGLDQVRAFVRGYTGGHCFFITPVTLAANEATIEAFGSTPAPFMAFDEAFQRNLGFEPEINLRQVTAEQCPLIDYLARQTGPRAAQKPALSLKSDLLRSGDELVVSADARADKHVELLLISDEGAVHSLAGYAKRAGDTITAKLRVVGSDRSTDPQPQLVLALASPRPLTTAIAAAKNESVPAERFFKLVSEDAGRNGPVAVGVKYFKLSGGS
ncbi:protein kinase domain-containing protein [Methylorubrum aminovorans]